MDGYSEWQACRAESVRVAAGLRDDDEFPPDVYPTQRAQALVERTVATAMVDLPLPPDYFERPFLSASIPGVTVVLPQLDNPASYPRPSAQLPPVERFARYGSTAVTVDGWSTLDASAPSDPQVALARAAGR